MTFAYTISVKRIFLRTNTNTYYPVPFCSFSLSSHVYNHRPSLSIHLLNNRPSLSFSENIHQPTLSLSVNTLIHSLFKTHIPHSEVGSPEHSSTSTASTAGGWKAQIYLSLSINSYIHSFLPEDILIRFSNTIMPPTGN